MIESVTDARFDERVLRSSRPVLVDFTATWCPPCRMIEPVLAEIAAERAGELDVVSLDVDLNPRTAAAAGVMGMPTLSLYVDGRVVTQVVGARPKRAVLRAIEPYLPVDNSVS
ncbi:MAG: thioredoxin [Pseudonocardia sp.]|nr:thioredoxin [Pseudonocardia sp.]